MADINLTYTVGTVSVSANGTVVTGSGDVIWTSDNVRQWDWISINGSVPTPISSINFVAGTTAQLTIPAWSGGDQASVPYIIYQFSRFWQTNGQTNATVQQLINWLTNLPVMISVSGDAPDPSSGEDGWYALKSNTAGWKLWYKESGEWVEQGAPVGSETRGPWDSATEYLINDEAFDPDSSGLTATWRSRTINTNKKPKDNPNDWYLAAAPGVRGSTWTIGTSVPANSSGNDLDSFVLIPLWDIYQRQSGTWTKVGNIRGSDGGAISIPYTFDGTSQSVAAPGSGKLRLSQATQNTSTTIAVNPTDNRGIDFSAVLPTLGNGSSATKQIVRLYKAADQTKFLLFSVSSVNTGTGFYGLAVTPVGGSSASPFSDGDALVIAFAQVGDKGDAITGPIGTSYRERVYDAGTTYVSNTTYIDRVIYNGQTWTCIVASVTGVAPDSDATKWVLAARGVDPSVISAATTARDQAEAALTSVQAVQSDVNTTAATVASDKTAAASSANAASTSASSAASTATTIEGLITSALSIAAQAADDGDADDGTGTNATVDDGDADI